MLKTYWWKTPLGKIKNFGDQLNPYLIEKITGMKPVHSEPDSAYDTLLCIGSILCLQMEKLKYCHVWGSGFGRKPSHLKCFIKRKKITKPKTIYAVRGPLTRKAFIHFGIACPEIYGDPALLLPRFYLPKVKKKHAIGIIPHYTDSHNPWVEKCKGRGYLIIDVNRPVEEVICGILACEMVVSSSLHGLIVSDAYGIPSLWAVMSSFLKKQSFKFYDYFASLGHYDEKPIVIGKESISENLLMRRAHYRELNIDLDKLLSVCPLIQ